MKQIVSTNGAPAAIGPYSQAIRSGGMLFSAGQIALDPRTGQLIGDDIAAQTRRVLENLSAILRAEHLNFGHVVKTTIFLTNMNDFQTVNEIYGTYFRQNPPARSTIGVASLPKSAKIEIEMIAMVGEDSDGGKIVGDTSG
jgi:2-iminobutanoate/2-iminopropanoate deaminase